RLAATCPAPQSSAAVGCVGAAGAPQLHVSSAWVGGHVLESGSQMAPTTLAVTVRGFAPTSLPIATLLPQAAPGCILGVDPVSLGLIATLSGSAESQLLLPNDPSIVGAVLYSQWVALEVDAALTVIGVSATNAVASTVGLF
ncbi:MAG: hypothetical protein AB8H80_00660, partial [Planctomycetota bacterium]